MSSCDKHAILRAPRLPFACALLPLLMVLVLLPLARGETYNVVASGDGLDLSDAMAVAEAGDTVSLADGTYDGAIVSTKDGTADAPITVTGGRGAIIKGDYDSRSVLVTHSFITLKVCI